VLVCIVLFDVTFINLILNLIPSVQKYWIYVFTINN